MSVLFTWQNWQSSKLKPSKTNSLVAASASGWLGKMLGMLGMLARTPSEKLVSWQIDWTQEKEEGISFVAKVSFTGPLAFLSSDETWGRKNTNHTFHLVATNKQQTWKVISRVTPLPFQQCIRAQTRHSQLRVCPQVSCTPPAHST